MTTNQQKRFVKLFNEMLKRAYAINHNTVWCKSETFFISKKEVTPVFCFFTTCDYTAKLAQDALDKAGALCDTDLGTYNSTKQQWRINQRWYEKLYNTVGIFLRKKNNGENTRADVN